MHIFEEHVGTMRQVNIVATKALLMNTGVAYESFEGRKALPKNVLTFCT